MFKHVVFRILTVLVMIAVIAGIAGFAFNAGVARGVAMGIQAPASGAQAVPYYGYGMWYPHVMPFFGFGFLGLLVPLFLLFLFFGAMRRMMWGGRFGGAHMHNMHHGPWSEKGDGDDFVPPMFAEWHRRAHTPKDEKPAETPEK